MAGLLIGAGGKPAAAPAVRASAQPPSGLSVARPAWRHCLRTLSQSALTAFTRRRQAGRAVSAFPKLHVRPCHGSRHQPSLVTFFQVTLTMRAQEAKNSRLWSGFHFPIDNDVGLAHGQQVGRLVIDAMSL